jgi:hypothetical protein
MKTAILVFGLVLSVLACSQTIYAADKEVHSGTPWKKFNFGAGGFINAMDSSIRLGTKNIGIEVDAEDALGIDASTLVFRFDGAWRFTKNLHHRVDLNWFALRREGSKTLLEDFEIGDTVFEANTVIKSNLDIDIIRASYSYSFFQDDRMDLAATGGFYIMPISFQISAQGIFEGEEKADITAPLPTLGLRLDFAVTPKWILRNHFDMFYLAVADYKGYITNFGTAIEWRPFKHVGFGFGFDSFDLGVEAENDDNIAGVDFVGNVKFGYFGALLYLRAFF